jgi:putative hemolysin
MTIGLEVGIILLLLLTNALFAMAEIALVSARKGRLRYLADAGDKRAGAALDLAESPNRFLATVQVGITLVGILAGAFGGATLAERIAEWLRAIPLLAPYARAVGFAIVVVGITYLWLVIGELAPKRLALGNPEEIAMRVARWMNKLSSVAYPAVSFLGWSTDALLRMFRIKPAAEASVSEEEIKLLVREGMRAGVFLPHESVMVEGVLALDRIPVRQLMTPRPKVIWVNLHDSHEAIWHKIVVSGHTTFPVYETKRDQVVGVISVKDIYANLAAGIEVRVKDLMTPPMVVPESQTASSLLEKFKKCRKHVALVADEFGGIAGLVSMHDIMEAIIGEFPSPDERIKPAAKRREDGSWLVDGMLEIEEVERQIPGFTLPPPSQRDYQTFAGFVVSHLGHLPHEGETFLLHGYHVEIIDMDAHRVDKVLLMPRDKAGEPPVRTASGPST